MGQFTNQTEAIKNFIKQTFLYDLIRPAWRLKAIRNWERKGRPAPPPSYFKQQVVRGYAQKFSLDTLIETGTQFGDMVYANRNTFDKIYSIELDGRLWALARKRFSRFDHIHIVPGDSGKTLPFVLGKINSPCLFWLDGHAMVGGARSDLITPIRQELDSILNHSLPDHVILIDDARLFRGDSDYPTIEEVKEIVLDRHPNWVFGVGDDIIRAHKNGACHDSSAKA